MSVLFKYGFEILTDPLELPIPVFWDYVIITILGYIAYKISLKKVGTMYHRGLISGSTAGSFFHWVIRFIYLVFMWAVVYMTIVIVRFCISNWVLICGMLIALFIVILGICEYNKEVNNGQNKI